MIEYYCLWYNICLSVLFRYKDGVPISKYSSCYKMSGYSLIITSIQLNNAGVFTLSLGNQAKNLYRNLSYTLFVFGKILL